MASKATNPMTAWGAVIGFGNVLSRAASDKPEYSLDYTVRQQQHVARRARASPSVAALVASLAFTTPEARL